MSAQTFPFLGLHRLPGAVLIEISDEEAHHRMLCVEEGCSRCCRETAANRPERAVK